MNIPTTNRIIPGRVSRSRDPLAPSKLRRTTNERSENGDDPYGIYSSVDRLNIAKGFLELNKSLKINDDVTKEYVVVAINDLSTQLKEALLIHLNKAPNPTINDTAQNVDDFVFDF